MNSLLGLLIACLIWIFVVAVASLTCLGIGAFILGCGFKIDKDVSKEANYPPPPPVPPQWKRSSNI